MARPLRTRSGSLCRVGRSFEMTNGLKEHYALRRDVSVLLAVPPAGVALRGDDKTSADDHQTFLVGVAVTFSPPGHFPTLSDSTWRFHSCMAAARSLPTK